MAYVPPVGAVTLVLRETGYLPPVGSVALNLGDGLGIDRLVALTGQTGAPSGLLTLGVRASARLEGILSAPSGALPLTYDPNLLSAAHRHTTEGWRPGAVGAVSGTGRWQGAPVQALPGWGRWRPAMLSLRPVVSHWRPGRALQRERQAGWQPAAPRRATTASHWQGAPPLRQDAPGRWSAAPDVRTQQRHHWRDLPLALAVHQEPWRAGAAVIRHWRLRANDGPRLIAVEIEVWQTGGYPGNAPNPAKDRPPPRRWLRLNLFEPLPTAPLRLNLGAASNVGIALRIRRTYMSVNTASLARWPDLTPLPCTALTIETDFDSWCWGLSATLAGPDAWALVQPNPLACEVLATINGQEWKFLLDVPSTSRAFNSDRVSLKGRSRSAWLHEPYTPPRNQDEAEAREMVQVAEAALPEDCGWTLDWQLENWLIPAGRYASWNTPIGALMRLVQVTDDGLYTEPALQVLRAVKRWPTPSWQLDADAPVDVWIPESAVISLTQSPVYTPPYNGVYVSGISHGAIALVKIAGTDGALQPGEPITHELLSDAAGVGARQRGLNFLSDSGAGYELDAELLFTPEVGLVRPGLIVSIAGMKGVSRSVKISAQWGGDGLTVRQSIGLERREVEL